MEDDEYERLCALTEYPYRSSCSDSREVSVSEEIFLVIKRQAEHRRLRAALRLHRQDKALKRYIARHGDMAKSADFSPCMLARVLLEAKYGWSKTTISNLFKDIMNGSKKWPMRVPSHEFRHGSNAERKEMAESEYMRLWTEVEECIHHDPYCSPLADRIRHNMGLEYEYILIMKLRSRGLLFESEDTLREKGLSKTPDVRLLLPIGVRDTQGELHIVNWIDSKAMFGDRHTHESENAGQLQGYVNRYGPGMVIYWFGHVAQLSSDRDVYITDSFPRQIVLPGDMDPFLGHPPSSTEGGALEMQVMHVETTFDDQLQPMTVCHE